jgi:hypothetical protein
MPRSSALTELDSLDIDDLRRRWAMLYSTVPGNRISRDMLIRGVAYRLQEQTHGARSKALLRRLRGLAKDLSDRGGVIPTQTPSFKPGTKLIREWQGQVHEVVILDRGYLWAGKHYRSLTQIARLITGTRWSGPRFFGLEVGRGTNTAAEPSSCKSSPPPARAPRG